MSLNQLSQDDEIVENTKAQAVKQSIVKPQDQSTHQAANDAFEHVTRHPDRKEPIYIGGQGRMVAGAVKDLSDGFDRWRLVLALAWQDIKMRYRGSILGPFWITISMGVMIGTLGFLYSALFKLDAKEYLPFLAGGILTWNLISSLITEGCDTFIRASHYIKQIRFPASVFVYRMVLRNLIVFAHTIVIYGFVMLAFAIPPSWTMLASLGGLLIFALNGAWVSLFLGTACARFRDIPPIIGSMVQIAFFLSPIIWRPDLLGDKVMIVDYNIFYYFLQLIRGPLMGDMPPLHFWLVTCGVTALGWIGAFFFFAAYRRRIAYWVG